MNSGETAATNETAPFAAPPKHDHAFEPAFQRIRDRLQKIAVHAADIVNDRRNAVHRLNALQQFARGVRGFALRAPTCKRLFQFLLMREQRFDFLFQFVNRRIHFARERFDQMQFVIRAFR